jgi:hypothetical protein
MWEAGGQQSATGLDPARRGSFSWMPLELLSSSKLKKIRGRYQTVGEGDPH